MAGGGFEYGRRPGVQRQVQRVRRRAEACHLLVRKLQHQRPARDLHRDQRRLAPATAWPRAVPLRRDVTALTLPQAGPDFTPQLISGPAEFICFSQPVLLLRSVEGRDLSVMPEAERISSARVLEAPRNPYVIAQGLII